MARFHLCFYKQLLDEAFVISGIIKVEVSVISSEAAKRRGKYPILATDTEVNNCFSIY